MSETNAVTSASAALAAAETALAAVEAAAPATPAAALDAWLAAQRNSALSRDTDSWNRVHGLVQQIKAVMIQVKE